MQDAFIKALTKLGGTFDGDFLPINNTDFSATLIKAKGYKPNVLLNNMGGLTQINCMKQFTQFGMQKEMALGGALFELESVKAVSPEAQTGWWDMEWWWNQPNVPEVVKFVADYRAATKKTPSARDWFGYVSMHSVRLAADKAKSLEGPKLAKAHGGHGAAAGRGAAARQGALPRRRSRADAEHLRRRSASAEVGPRRRLHRRGAGAGRRSRRFGRRYRMQDGAAGLICTPDDTFTLRHCEERSDEAIQHGGVTGLLRFARNDA